MLPAPGGVADTERPAEWWLSRSAAKALYALLDHRDASGDELDHEVSDLALTHGDLVYAELIFLLTRLRVDPTEARALWPLVTARRREMEARLGHRIDVRAALLNYFVHVERRLERPKVVEMDWAEWAAASALLDEVTGLPNQRFFREQLARDIERSHRDSSPLSLIVLDADDFKRINERFGHDVGTATLCDIARQLRRHAREEDLVVRYGGDEFVVLCPSTTKAEAGQLAEVLRRAVASCVVEVPGEVTPVGITVSVGVATCPGDATDGTILFALADHAAYRAKDAGKNCVQLYGGSTRSYPRRRVALPGQIVPAGAPAIAIETVEIGEGGFAFRTEHDLATGTLVEAVLTEPEGAVVRLAARVAWCRPHTDTGWEVAVRFVEQGGEDRDRLTRWLRGAAGI
jgi:diguanylate cyclase (GGDEF)-like protein